MNAVIDVGGGLRAIYTAGVFDKCLDDKVSFDLCIGVSAGSANIATFLAGQKGRNYRFYRDYSQRKEYMSLSNFIKNASYINLDYVYSTLTNSDGEDPINFKSIEKYDGRFYTVATDVKTGKAHYFLHTEIHQDDYEILKASCALPIVCKPYEINGRKYMDGGVSEPVPIKKAIDEGADKIVLLLTKPRDVILNNRRNAAVAKLIKRKYPESADALNLAHKKYSMSLELATRLEKEGKLLVVAPDNCEGVKTLTKDKTKLHCLYEKGYIDGEKIKNFLSE